MAKIYFSFEADSVAEFNEMVSSLALMQQVEKKCCSSEKVATTGFITPVTFKEQLEQNAAEILSNTFGTPLAVEPDVPVLTQQEAQEAAAEEEVKQRRKRRTKAEIEADNAREAAAAAGVVAEVVSAPEVLIDELVKVIAPIEPALEGEVLPAGEAVQTDWVDQANQATGTPSFAPPPPSSTPNFNFGTLTQQAQPLNTVAQTPSALPQDLLAALSGMALPK